MESINLEKAIDDLEEELLREIERRKKARLRTRGPYRKSWNK